MIGAYNYDPDIFTKLDLPDGLDRETVINNILLRCGESPILYDNPDFIKLMIGTWSKKWKPSFERMITALDEEYNPLHNFDRYEKYDDERHNTDSNRTDGELNRTTSQNKTDTTSYNSTITEGNEIDEDISYSGSDITLNDVSAFNETNYQPSSKNSLTSSNTSGRDMTEDKTTEHTGKDELKTVDSQSLKDVNAESKSGKFDETSKHDGHLYGNVGTTKSQEMVIDEVNLRKKINIYDVIAEMFYNEFCIYVY